MQQFSDSTSPLLFLSLPLTAFPLLIAALLTLSFSLCHFPSLPLIFLSLSSSSSLSLTPFPFSLPFSLPLFLPPFSPSHLSLPPSPSPCLLRSIPSPFSSPSPSSSFLSLPLPLCPVIFSVLKMVKSALNVGLVFSLYSTFFQGGFFALLVCWGLGCVSSDLFIHYMGEDMKATTRESEFSYGKEEMKGGGGGGGVDGEERSQRDERFKGYQETSGKWSEPFTESEFQESGSGFFRSEEFNRASTSGRGPNLKKGSRQDQEKKSSWSFPGGPWRKNATENTSPKTGKGKFREERGFSTGRNGESPGDGGGGGTYGSPPTPPGQTGGGFPNFFERFRRGNSDNSSSSSPSSSTGGVSQEGRQFSSEGASTTGRENAELSPEEEVLRVLRCEDHYSVLGLERYASFDGVTIKREYRRKAVLVHPDKHKGNEEASDAFKRLQNAYEVLLDEDKRKEYDEELRRQLFLEGLRERVRKARGQSEEELPPDSKRVDCLSCGESHVWKPVQRTRSEARWCQECKEFHPAKEGDGWTEQSCNYFFLGLIPTMGPLRAYTLSEGKVYDISQWVECQKMKSLPNTHKPTFFLKTTVKCPSEVRGKPGSKGNKHDKTDKNDKNEGFSQNEGVDIPFDFENMSEEEIMDYVARAMAAGFFDESDLFSDMRGRGNSGGPRNESQNKKGSAKKRRRSRRTQF